MRIGLVFVCFSIAACSSGPSPTAPMPTPMPSPSPMPSTTTTEASPASTAEGSPPSGFYRYALHVVSDDCTPAMQNVEEKAMMVFAHTTSKGLVLNVPLGVQPGGAIARSDIEATVGKTILHATKNAACPAADVRRTLVVKDVSRSLVVLDETFEHMDASSCAPPGPKACTSRVEIRLTLEEAKCEATCGATVDMTKKPPQFVCKCP